MAAMLGSLLIAGSVSAETVDERLDRIDEELEEIRGSSGESGSKESAVSLHGYGEMHYNNLDGSGGAASKRELDFHRFVLYVGYDYTERIRFVSELELEHSLSGEGK